MWFCYMTQAVSNFWTQRCLTSSWYYRCTLPCLALDLPLIVDVRRLMFSTSTSTSTFPTSQQSSSSTRGKRDSPRTGADVRSVRSVAHRHAQFGWLIQHCMEPQGIWLAARGTLWQRGTLHLDSRQCGSDTGTGSGKGW